MANETIEVLRIPGTLFPRGAFDENADYKFLNFVESGGNGYVCLQPCTGIPVTNTAYWFKFVFKGDKGDAFTYADLTAEQKAELVRDATAAAQAAATSAQSAADDAAAALQKFNTIKAAIDAIDPQSTEGSIQTLAAKQGLLEADLNALGPKVGQETKTYGTEILTASYYIKSDGTMSYSTSYITSAKIAITKGTKVKIKAGTPSAYAYCFAAYEKDGTLIEVWKPSGTGTGGASTYEFTASKDLDVRVGTGSNASYAPIFEFTIYATGLLSAINDITDAIGNIEDHIEEIDDSIEEIGVEDVKYIPTAFTRSGYIQSDGTIASHNSYYLSTKIPVKKGCTINIKAGTPSTSAYPLAVFSVGGTLLEAWCPSSIVSIQTHTYTATDDVEILACCNNNATYVQSFVLEVKGFGIKGDLSELQPKVDSVTQKMESLEDSVTSLVGERSFSFVGAYTTKKQVDFSTIVGHKYRIVFPESGWVVNDIYNYNTGLAVFVVSSFDGTSYTEYSSTVRYVNRGVPTGYIDLEVETNVTSMWIRADNGSEFDIMVVDMDAKSIASILSSLDSIKNVQTISPFSFAPIMHHINVAKYSNVTIPSQTILDVSYAKRIGAKYIEANVHKCSDGVYVCRHGNQGKLGSGLLFDGDTYNENTLFTAISSTDLRTYVKCDSVLNKWQFPIPTLDEFCAECKKLGMGILVQCIDSGVLSIVRKYLTDDMIVAYNLSQRGDFRGTIMTWASAASAEDMLEVAEGFGAPFLFGWNNWASVSDSVKNDALLKMHKKGYMVGTAYLNTEGAIKALELGIDEIAASFFLINAFDDGNLHHITSLDDSNLNVSGGVTYDSTTKTISMPSSGLIKIQDEAYASKIAKVSVRLRYSGTLGIYVGVASNGNYGLANYVSDGSKEISFAGVSEFRDTLLVISAAAQTTIYDIKIDTSLVY